MTIHEVSVSEYSQAVTCHPHVFNTADFAQLNAYKADRLRCLLFADGKGKTRLGIIMGERGGRLASPFSAPFGGFSACGEQRLEYVDEAVALLAEWAKKERKDIRVVLPPQFYSQNLIGHSINALSRRAELHHIDLDYYFPLDKFARYVESLERAARKNLHRAEGAGFVFTAVQSGDHDGIRRAYDVIRRNREEHGYPLRMSLADVEATMRLIRADFFILSHEGVDVAAAQVFHVADGIGQVIYWGDLRAWSALRPMNYLACRVFGHYSREGLRILDIGPSTEDGVPNFGLCDFKSSIGCEIAPKFVFDIKA